MKLLCYMLMIGGLFMQTVKGQNREMVVAGTVSSSDNGTLLGGASVREKGQHTATKADANGNFTISVSSPNSVLTISHVGYQTKEIELKGQTKITVVLEATASALEG